MKPHIFIQCECGIASVNKSGRTEPHRTDASCTIFNEASCPTTSGKICMHAAYKNVPPENKTHRAVEDAEDRAGMAPIRPYVINAASGDADEKASRAF